MERFVFWRPEADRCVEIGPERRQIPLPVIPLPLLTADSDVLPPSDDAIGRGLYDYLRQYPLSEYATAYALLLRDAYPHYLADLAAQVIMLDEKEVDSAYLRRKITGLQVFALLEPDNPALLLQIGRGCFDLALEFTELVNARPLLLEAMGYLQRIGVTAPQQIQALDLMAHIDLWFGDIPSARRRLIRLLEYELPEESRQQIEGRIVELNARALSDIPPVDELEALGHALVMIGNGHFSLAEGVLEGIEQRAILPQEMMGAEFYYLLGLCREEQGDAVNAMRAYDRSLALDNGYLAAREGMARLGQGGLSS